MGIIKSLGFCLAGGHYQVIGVLSGRWALQVIRVLSGRWALQVISSVWQVGHVSALLTAYILASYPSNMGGRKSKTVQTSLVYITNLVADLNLLLVTVGTY